MTASLFNLLVTGEEQLSGKRQDKHLARVIELLANRGLNLSTASYVGDGEAAIAAAIAAVAERGEILLCTGGIGATPDDRTRQAAARALGLSIERHAEAEALIVARSGAAAYPYRVLMADFPKGAELIPNPINRVAGFSVGHCHFMPGFPEMAWPMIEWVLDSHYHHLHAEPAVEYLLRVPGNAAESDLLELMEAVLAAHPGLKFSSLPFRGGAGQQPHIECGFKGPAALSASAYQQFAAGLAALGMPMEAIRPP